VVESDFMKRMKIKRITRRSGIRRRRSRRFRTLRKSLKGLREIKIKTSKGKTCRGMTHLPQTKKEILRKQARSCKKKKRNCEAT
jgi:hypothetical protein